jgi:hypothetical protein
LDQRGVISVKGPYPAELEEEAADAATFRKLTSVEPASTIRRRLLPP